MKRLQTNECEMKNIVLLCECEFTRSGLEALLGPKARFFSTSDFSQCRSYLSLALDGEVDIVVLSVRSCGIGALLRRNLPSCSVLMDPGSASIPLLRFYLNCLNAHVGLIDFAQPLLALQHFIEQVMSGERVLSVRDIISGESLSLRERNTLQRMIGGHKADDIARTLSLSVKTVSRYKRTGLRKLGARNLQDLLLPSVDRYPRVCGSMWLHDISDALAYQYIATG